MVFTVKKLSDLSKVTVRTLHFYEEIGLLHPRHGENGYRLFEEKDLLELQQILFFKELGFTLTQIKKVLGKSDFDKLKALEAHKRALQEQKENIKKMLKTIDKTLNHLQGNIKMKPKEFFYGFSEVKYNPDTASDAEKIVLKSAKKSSDQKKDKNFYEGVDKRAKEIFRKIALCIEKGLKPGAKEVQLLIKKHYDFAKEFHELNKEVYLAFSKLYKDHPAFRSQLETIHPYLAEFCSEAMKIFAENFFA